MNTIFIFAMFLCPNDRWYIVLQGRQQFQTEPELVFCCSNSYCICGRHQRQTWNLSICHMFTPAKSPNLCFVIMWKPTKSPPPVEEKKNWEGEEENIWRRKILCYMLVLGQYRAALVVTWWYLIRTDKQQQKSDYGRTKRQTDRISSLILEPFCRRGWVKIWVMLTDFLHAAGLVAPNEGPI